MSGAAGNRKDAKIISRAQSHCVACCQVNRGASPIEHGFRFTPSGLRLLKVKPADASVAGVRCS